MNFTLVELTKITLEPNEVLSVKLYGDDFDPENVAGLQEQLKQVFPNNKIMMFMLPNGNDLQMEKISANVDIKENKELSETERLVRELSQNSDKELVMKAKAPVSDCSVPTSYCSTCACGKKEAFEKRNKK